MSLGSNANFPDPNMNVRASNGRPHIDSPALDQNAFAPCGEPRPVGPSQPERATHHWLTGQLPLLPVRMSRNEVAELLYSFIAG